MSLPRLMDKLSPSSPVSRLNRQALRVDFSSVEVEPLPVEALLGEGRESFKSTHYRTQVCSPDLKRLYLATDFGLTMGLSPSPPGAFFSGTLDDDTSFKLLCPCLHRLTTSQAEGSRLFCAGCGRTSPYLKSAVDPLWLCSSARGLSVNKAKVREERSQGRFSTITAQAVGDFMEKHDFTNGLVEWVEPFCPNPLQAHEWAWDLADTLEDVWVAWKSFRRLRRPEKRLAGFRGMEAIWGGIEEGLMAVDPTGSSVMLSRKEVEARLARNEILT